MKNKKLFTFFVLIGILVIASGCKQNSNQTAGNSENNKVEESKNLTIEKKTINEDENNQEVNVEYPFVGAAAIDDNISEFVNKQIAEFKNEMKDIEPIPGVDWKYSVYIRYQTFFQSDKVLSFRFDVSFFTGGAHPNNLVYAKNYNLESGTEIKTADMFREDSDYVNQLSTIALADINSREGVESDWTSEGAGAKAENFSEIIFDNSEIDILFDPYQVAPYAVGVVEVKIPYADLADVLSDDFKTLVQ